MENNIYREESIQLENSKLFQLKKNITVDQYKQEYSKLFSCFEELLTEIKIMTKVGDRQEKRLNEKNEELKLTIDELTRVKISRKATTIVFIVAIAIFLILEAFIEPIIERHTEFYYGLIAKLVLVLSIKPIEMALEHKLLNKAKRKEATKS